MIRANQTKNEQLVNNISDELINLRNSVNRKEIPENENSNKIVDIVEKSSTLISKKKGKGIKILTLNKCFKYYR